MKLKIQIIKPFGPSILKTTIPNEILNKLNNYIEKTVADKKKTNELDYGQNSAGDVTQGFNLEKKFVKECGWLSFLASCVKEWIKNDQKKDITKFSIINSWVVRQFKDEYNPIHWHGGHISGVGFLKVPQTFGNHIQEKRGREYVGGKLDLIHGSRQFANNSIFRITPKVGDFYFFPNYLMHSVYPFYKKNEERRSISFNALIDENIYNSN